MSLPLIIIPVFNAFEQLKTCLDSVAQSVTANTRVLLIDDASTDPRVRPFLRSWVEQAESFHLEEHERNRGFVAAANRGMEQAEGDVVLLNSDTAVHGGWLERLAACLQSDAGIATATPWSNNGEIVSLPEFCVANPIPGKAAQVASVIAACGRPRYPELPTAVGFCMAISSRAIKSVGLFDEETFGRGYGEENDFCLRAEQAGMRNVLCDDVYVSHHGGASFGPLGLEPDSQSMARLLEKHPAYMDRISKYIQADPLAKRRQEIIDCLQRQGVKLT